MPSATKPPVKVHAMAKRKPRQEGFFDRQQLDAQPLSPGAQASQKHAATIRTLGQQERAKKKKAASAEAERVKQEGLLSRKAPPTAAVDPKADREQLQRIWLRTTPAVRDEFAAWIKRPTTRWRAGPDSQATPSTDDRTP